MGASIPIECPVEGCSYTATFRLPMGEETGAGMAERRAILREEHPNHPPDDADNQSELPSISN